MKDFLRQIMTHSNDVQVEHPFQLHYSEPFSLRDWSACVKKESGTDGWHDESNWTLFTSMDRVSKK